MLLKIPSSMIYIGLMANVCVQTLAFTPNLSNPIFQGLGQQNYGDDMTATALFAKIGVIFGTSTGSTETVASLIAEEFGSDAEGPLDIDDLAESSDSLKGAFDKYDALIVGTPTWNTGADTERSGTSWDEIYYGNMQGMYNGFWYALEDIILQYLQNVGVKLDSPFFRFKSFR
jgi:hypothetical protein